MLIHQVGEKNRKCRRRTRPLCALVSLDQASLSYHPCSVLRVARSHQLLNQLFSVSVIRFILSHYQRRFHHTVSASMQSNCYTLRSRGTIGTRVAPSDGKCPKS